ncbi:MAG: sigma-E factor negative regulatory protein [Gammaproteobacteria bacterium]|nr:sigma-E factor negative regulatory protein [Gammaproteobacteria bacterium]
MYENLSALIDNELDELERARVLRELGQDTELAERWSRYHVIGLAMRREPIAAVGDLPARVARALDDEAAPAGRTSSIRPMGRLAVAASVAGVLLVGGLMVKLYQDSGPAGMQPAQQLAVNDEGMHWEGADPGSVDALNALLVEHGEFTSASGMNGLTAYTKFVAYDSR